MSTAHASGAAIWKQPMTVWAIAFAAVVSFMGIGLVDPILPAIAKDLNASPTETELLFTSYLVVTGLAMFFTSWVSSRIGVKRTLMIGLALIVVFAAVAALSGSVGGIIGFRAGWGLGNALFISTALSAIIGAATGGSIAAIILYEAALGLGIAIGPLIGGLLGEISWQAPFFGTAALMAVGFIAIATLLKKETARPARTSLAAPFKALGNPRLLVLAIAALFYNIAFFVLLAYSPFQLGFGALGIGFTFFGWGLMLALFSVFVAPALTARLPRTIVLPGALVLLAIDLVVGGLLVHNQVGLVTAIVIGGAVLGIMNTVLTESVMEATDLPRSVASSAYSGVRFLGGAAAPPLATWLAAVTLQAAMPYFVGAGFAVASAILIFSSRKLLRRIDGAEEAPEIEVQAISVGDAD